VTSAQGPSIEPSPLLLGVENAVEYLVGRGLLERGSEADASELTGGVSSTVVAVRGTAGGLVVKQALPRLRVEQEWLAGQQRAETEAAAMQLYGELTPGRVPRLLDVDPGAHVLVMELLPEGARNWQAEVAGGTAHAEFGRFAGQTLGIWHARTAGDERVARAFDDYESFEQLRLRPFFETMIERLPGLADGIGLCLAELRERKVCLVHGDYAMKNMLIGESGSYVLDFEVAHYGNPVFDLGFFLSFVILSAIRWPALAGQMQELAAGFVYGYDEHAGGGFAGDPASVVAHTACLMLARTDGKSPAQFLDEPSRARARQIGSAMLRRPEQGLWAWR
jgi:tRNA A-37 threonylcarbamoyl transferase component Bud32